MGSDLGLGNAGDETRNGMSGRRRSAGANGQENHNGLWTCEIRAKRQMTTSTRGEKGTTIVDVVGQIDPSSSPRFRKTLLESLKGTPRLAVNLIQVKSID